MSTHSHASGYDVIIVGGGPAGCAAALSLRKSNPDVTTLLLDDADPAAFKIGESLPADAKNMLVYLSPTLYTDFTKDIAEGVHMPCSGNASAWETPDLRETYAVSNPFGMGLHLDRARFDQCLRDAVAGTTAGSQCTVVHGVFNKVEKTEAPEYQGWIVYVRRYGSGETDTYRAKWLVDASGRKASVARKLGAKTIKTDALLAFHMLFSATASTQHDHDGRTVIEAATAGWWYTAQLPRGRRVVVYHTNDDDASAKLARKQAGFLALLDETKYISRVIAEHGYEAVAEGHGKEPRPGCTAAGSSHLVPPMEDRLTHGWLAVGDAAMAFDPLSSQGMITAMKMGCVVGDALARRLRGEPDVEDLVSQLLRTYIRVRSRYEDEKGYFYDQVSRFTGPFWESKTTA
ncbi:hypothetical protein POSPLADRAFT_1036953 [Postia placenta MAD-698-R-SB12]|uniref:FAD-binding domain-containing protein n=1 Tax=Postia placenta MAD-698-R-SB12 TaxID=670580 RepID=A0A1X6MM87_9APHY|nr:hypothetical protein POSPLADRAFT_1036953 [Postia placenta MAD-698-R-SB12]OSX57524.1 hypothetical protein POSPLADRAFT_1036953 [Postia placenta MAD-698-R-SB12]